MPVFHRLGIYNQLYWGCYVLGFLTIFVFNAFYGRNYGISPKRSIPFTILSYVLIYGWAYILAWIVNGFEWGHHNAIRVYIWFPLVLFFTGKLFRVKLQTACEFMAPSTCIVYGIARLGCVFAGCCYGYPALWGIPSVPAGYSCFPVQLCESITALLIAGYLIHRVRKNEYKPTGKLYPTMLMLYGGTRFIWEFFADNTKIIFNISELALWALGTFLLGASWLLTVQAAGQKKGRASK